MQTERRIYLTKELLAEQPRYRDISIPDDQTEQRKLLVPQIVVLYRQEIRRKRMR